MFSCSASDTSAASLLATSTTTIKRAPTSRSPRTPPTSGRSSYPRRARSCSFRRSAACTIATFAKRRSPHPRSSVPPRADVTSKALPACPRSSIANPLTPHAIDGLRTPMVYLDPGSRIWRAALGCSRECRLRYWRRTTRKNRWAGTGLNRRHQDFQSRTGWYRCEVPGSNRRIFNKFVDGTLPSCTRPYPGEHGQSSRVRSIQRRQTCRRGVAPSLLSLPRACQSSRLVFTHYAP